MYMDIHVKHLLFSSDFNQHWTSKKYSNTTFHENSSSGSKFFPYWQTDGCTDMTKLIGVFRSRKIVKSAWNLCSSEYHIKHKCFSCLWFRASLFYINNCPTRCNSKQSIYYSASSLYMFRVSTTPIIRSTQNCNYSLRYWSYFFVQLPPSNAAKLVGRR